MKTCEVCERPLVKRKKEAYWQFEARRYCSRPCAHQARGIAQRVVNAEFKARYRQITPHKTKRARQQTCGEPACKNALISLRNQEHQARRMA